VKTELLIFAQLDLQIDFEIGKEKLQRHFLFHEEDEQISTSFTKENSLCNFAKGRYLMKHGHKN
jgi:hypothetical protein